MAYYTDIHTHILPGVDDGSQDMRTSMKMLREAYKEGVRTIFLTPHYIPGRHNASTETLKSLFEEIKEEAAEKLPELTIFLGNELYYRDGVVDHVRDGSALTMAGSDYVLVEFNTRSEFSRIRSAVKKFTEAGYRPILAHIERYDCLYKQIDLIDELIEAGAYMQVNVDSFPGGLFDSHAAFCRKLLEEGKISFLGSDCHDLDKRKPAMQSELKKLKAGKYEHAIERCARNTAKMIANEWI